MSVGHNEFANRGEPIFSLSTNTRLLKSFPCYSPSCPVLIFNQNSIQNMIPKDYI